MSKNNQQTNTKNAYNPDEVHTLDLDLIEPSESEAQALRRATFEDNDLTEIGTSIKVQGLQQPILVRPDGKKFRIVFGERRFLGSRRVGLKTIKCFIRELTDTEVLKMQYVENHKRQQSSPLGDALIFKALIGQGYDASRVADECATSAQNVTEKLKLIELIPEALKMLDDRKLPLRHAYYLATFPAETQEFIIKEGYPWQFNKPQYGAVSYAVFKEEIGVNIVRRLADAPFDTENAVLHKSSKGLKCSDCTRRTGASPALFADISPEDSCLDKGCFDFKTRTHMRIERENIAAELPNPENKPLAEKLKEVPVATERKYIDDKPPKAPVFTEATFIEAPECQFSIKVVGGPGKHHGKTAWICKNAEKGEFCDVHNPPPPPPVIDAEFIERRERLLNQKVNDWLREKIFTSCVKYIDDRNPAWINVDLVQMVIYKLWLGSNIDVRRFIFSLGDWNLPKDFMSPDAIKTAIAKLSDTQQNRLIFLLVTVEIAFLPDQTHELKKIAKEYARLDYDALETQIRQELADVEISSEV